MAYFRKADLQEAYHQERRVNERSAYEIINESTSGRKSFDIFLSHSFLNQKEVAGLTAILNGFGFSVYVDWIEDAHLNRKIVNRETAELLRRRMRSCKCLFYATSDAASNSRWMPWELGYMDGHSKRCAVIPILETDMNPTEFERREYLTLYPAVERLNGVLKIVDEGNSQPLRGWLRTGPAPGRYSSGELIFS